MNGSNDDLFLLSQKHQEGLDVVQKWIFTINYNVHVTSWKEWNFYDISILFIVFVSNDET